MANASKVFIDFSSLQGLREGLAGLKPSTQAHILAVTMEKATRPIVSLAKAKAPRKTGALRKSIGAVVRTYPEKGQVIGLIGSLRGYYKPDGKGIARKVKPGKSAKGADSPSNYSHLVEFGHRIVSAKGQSGAGIKGKSIRKGTIAASGFVAAHPFLRPAAEQGKEAADNAIAEGFGIAIERELGKARSKFTKQFAPK